MYVDIVDSKRYNRDMKNINKTIWIISLTVITLCLIVNLMLSNGVIGGNKIEEVKPKIEASMAEYEWTFVSWTPISPATGKFWFYVKNIGDGPGVPQCTIQMRDSTYLYRGLDIVWLTSPLPAGEIWAVSTPMVIKNEGSLYVDTHEISCKEK